MSRPSFLHVPNTQNWVNMSHVTDIMVHGNLVRLVRAGGEALDLATLSHEAAASLAHEIARQANDLHTDAQ